MSKIYHYWNTMYTERTTGLESFAVCPHKFANVPFDWSNIKTIIALEVGNIVHIAHQYPAMAIMLCDKFFDVVLPSLTGERDNLMKTQTLKMIDLAAEWIEEFDKVEKYFEIPNNAFIEWLRLTGSYDCLMIKDWEFHLWDYKTTANINYYQNWIEKVQALVYSFFIMEQYNVDKVTFTYQIYVKWKNNTKVESARKTKTMYRYKQNLLNQDEYIDNVEETVKKIAKNYIEAHETGWFLPEDKNPDGSDTSACRYCPMRNAQAAEDAGLEVCPTKKDLTVIDQNTEIVF